MYICMYVCTYAAFLSCLLLVFVYLMNCEWRTQQLHDVVLKLESVWGEVEVDELAP